MFCVIILLEPLRIGVSVEWTIVIQFFVQLIQEVKSGCQIGSGFILNYFLFQIQCPTQGVGFILSQSMKCTNVGNKQLFRFKTLIPFISYTSCLRSYQQPQFTENLTLLNTLFVSCRRIVVDFKCGDCRFNLLVSLNHFYQLLAV